MEYKGLTLRFDKICQDKGCPQRRMAAKVDFSAWCKPAQPVSVFFFYSKSGLGQIIFHGNVLHHLIGRPGIHNAYSGRISFEYFFRKGIDDVTFHDPFLLFPDEPVFDMFIISRGEPSHNQLIVWPTKFPDYPKSPAGAIKPFVIPLYPGESRRITVRHVPEAGSPR